MCYVWSDITGPSLPVDRLADHPSTFPHATTTGAAASGFLSTPTKRPLAAAAARFQPRAALHASAAVRLAAASGGSHSYADPLFDDVPDRR